MKKKSEKAKPKRRVGATFEILAGLDSLKEIRHAIEAQARALGIARPKIYRVVLAVEEATSNVIRHAYGKRRLKPVSIEIEMTRAEVKILIRDVGRPFDFGNHPSRSEVRQALKKRSRGGYGVHLIKSMVDRYEYLRSDTGENHLRLVKRLTRG